MTNKLSTQFSVKKALKESVTEIIPHWRQILKALAIPILILMVLDAWFYSREQSTQTELLFFPLETYLCTVIAVTLHRVLLLGVEALPHPWGFYWSSREFKYVGWCFAIILGTVLIGLIITAAISFPIGFALDLNKEEIIRRKEVIILFITLISYLSSRSLILLPSIAIDKPIEIHDAWNLSKGCGFKVMLVIMFPLLITGALGVFLYGIFGLEQNFMTEFLFSFFFQFLGIIGITVITVSFKALYDNTMDKV